MSRSAGQMNRSISQSLFNIYYLGQTKVDRRCNSSMMPWIIEELKLKADEMKFIWLSPGPEGVSFVADNGQELFNHSYGNILQCCIAVDGISFAYAARQEKDRYFCHVFQALTFEEASAIMQRFKQHAQEEVVVPPTITHNHSAASLGPSSTDVKSSGYIMSSSGGALPREEEYKLEYWGRYEVPSPASSTIDQVVIIDTLVSKYREAANLVKFRGKKRSFGSKFMRNRGQLESSESVVGTASLTSLTSTPSLTSVTSMTDATNPSVEGDSSASSSPKKSRHSTDGSDNSDVSITLTPSSPPPTISLPDGGGVACDGSTSPEDPSDQHTSCNQTLSQSSEATRPRPESSDFDTIPELRDLKTSTEFQALSLKPEATPSSTVQTQQKVRLLFSGVNVMVVTEQTEHVILKKSIRNIACCAQGKKENEFIAFTSRHKENKKYYCYLFMAKNSRKAVKVLESFKSAFVHALSLTTPAAVCEYCPYNQIQQLCKNLEGVSTQVAQSRLQDCLGTLSEADYNQIMSSYKVSEHADHEYTQIIVLVALLRQHFQRKQEKHTHRGLLPQKSSSAVSSKPPAHPQRPDSTVEDSSLSKLAVPALTRAKLAIANSFENLRSKPSDRRRRASQDRIESNHDAAQSLNNRTTSPLFARKTNLATLMAPVATSPLKQLPQRSRSWTADMGKSSDLPPLAARTGSTEETRDNSSTHRDEEISKTPHRISTARSISLHKSGRDRAGRHSLTPPSVTTVDKYLLSRGHRRSTSHVITGSWRQKIFDSVSTPSKLEGGVHSDDLEDWQVIEMGSQNGDSWKISKGIAIDLDSSPSTRARNRWKDAIKQQILLNRLEKENQLVDKESRRRLKLYYTSATGPESSEAIAVWRKLLEEREEEHGTQNIHQALLLGVPPSLREEVWQFLSELFQARHHPEWQFPAELSRPEALAVLGEQTTEYEHSITVDLGRTFPSHPYFASRLKEAGQAELQRVLHGYAVADSETGYCQGLSFVTGLILMHTNDEISAFKLLYKLMNLHRYREIYKGSLSNLQLCLYQLSRLMHDFLPDLHQLLQSNEVTPFYYAAPWFLTIFASQFPIAFTSRVFDLIFYDGTQILFKVALSMLKVHEASILECGTMEDICSFLKNRLPKEALKYEDAILKQALEFDFEGKLDLFETEYQVIAELNNRFSMDLPVDMESLTATLRRNNSVLVEQLAICHGAITTLQEQLEALQEKVLSQQQVIERLESERSAYPRDDTSD